MVTEAIQTDRPSPSDALPTAIGVLDRERPTEVWFPVAPIQRHHQRLRVMVRGGRRPLAFVEVPARDQAWDQQELAFRVEAALAGRTDAAHAATLPTVDAPATSGADLDTAELPLTVVVCTRDRAELLRRSLSSILSQAGAQTELVVVDNAARTSATRDVVAAIDDPRIRYVAEPRPGLSVARNTGMAHASHELVVFTDDDVIADPDWLAWLSAAARLGDAGCFTGAVPTGQLESEVQHFFERRVDWFAQLLPQLYRRGDDRGPLYPFSPGIFGTGANFAITRQTYRTVGPFDERLGAGRSTRGGEDLDYFFRVIWAGIGLRYEPAAMVWHIHRPDREQYDEQVLGYGIGFGAFATKVALSPRWALPFLLRVPRGIWMLRRAMRDAVSDNGLPPEYTALERSGMLRGPVELMRESVRQARVRRSASGLGRLFRHRVGR